MQDTTQLDVFRFDAKLMPVETATESGVAVFEWDKGSLENLVALDEGGLDCPAEGKPDLNFNHGFFSFRITDLTPGDEVAVKITLPADVPYGPELGAFRNGYWKCQDGAWLDVSSLMGDDDGDNEFTLTLTDGGLGDDDGLVNGEIVEPGGLGQLPPRTITVAVGGTDGTVVSEPEGINCGTTGADCTETHLKGMPVTLRAIPLYGSHFASWGGDCTGTGITTQIALDTDKYCTATFAQPIGGIAMPVNKLELVAPWMGATALAGLAALGIALVKRRRQGG